MHLFNQYHEFLKTQYGSRAIKDSKKKEILNGKLIIKKMSSTRIDPLTKENYDTWVIQAEAVLVRQKLYKYIEIDIDENASSTDKEKDREARSELILMISPTELKQIKNSNTAKALWNKLKDTYASKGPARKASLLKQLILLKAGSDVRDHLNKFLDIVDKLEDMDIQINKELLTIMKLYSLPSEYENFRVAIESRDTLPTPEILKIKIIEEADARQNKNYDEPSTSYQEEALLVYCSVQEKRTHYRKLLAQK